jgi:EmrB/QacA subfamily drug resistance transporter
VSSTASAPRTTEAAPTARPPGTREIVGSLSGVLLAVMLSALDQNIVTTALPAIARELHGLEHLSWTVVAYLLTWTTLTPIYGKLSDLFGRGRLMLLALAIFIVASALCALSQNLYELIAARALQGAGGGGLMVLSQAIIGDFVAPRERGRVQAFTSALWGASSICGPMLGGFFVDNWSWRFVFWINLPIGTLSFLLCRRAFARLPVTHIKRPIDYLGSILLIAATTALLVVSSSVGTSSTWLSPPLFITLALGLLLTVGFILWERRATEPLFPARLLRKRTIRLVSSAMFLISVELFTAIVMLPVFFQLVMHVGAGSSGALLIPLLISSTASSFSAGQFMRKTGRYKILVPLSFTLAFLGFVGLGTLRADTPLVLVSFYMVLLGVGIGTNYPVILTSAQNVADVGDLGAATSSVVFFRALGSSVGAAVFWSILLAALSRHLAAAGMESVRAAIFNGAALPAADAPMIEHALLGAFHVAFLSASVVALIGIVLGLLLREVPLRTTPRRFIEEAG